VKEVIIGLFTSSITENTTVCKAVNYSIAAGSYSKFAKALGVAAGFTATFAC
jgi:hypothetical protein